MKEGRGERGNVGFKIIPDGAIHASSCRRPSYARYIAESRVKVACCPSSLLLLCLVSFLFFAGRTYSIGPAWRSLSPRRIRLLCLLFDCCF